MNLLVVVLIGILSSLVASLVFLCFLTRIRPKIEISKQIAKEYADGDVCGQGPYKIKIINKTRRRIIDVEAQLHLMEIRVLPGGIIRRGVPIPLVRSKIMEIEKFDPRDESADYAFRFIIDADVEEIWKDDSHSFLRFRISATDSFSGFKRVFIMDYHKKRDCIKQGDFKFGNSLEIV